MRPLCSFWPRWLCPFRRERPPALVTPPKAARTDFDMASARLKGAALDGVDIAEHAAQNAIRARNVVRRIGERAARRAEESPIMRAANEAARQVSDSTGNIDDA